MMKMTIVQRIEQILRGICFFVYLFGVCCVLIVEPLFRPIYPSIDSFTGHYFSKNFKQGLVNEYIVKYWCKGVFQLFGINVINEFKGVPPKHRKDNAIVMFSHGSNLDPLLLLGTYPFFANFVAKKSLFKIPIFGTVMKTIGQIPIDRANLTSAIETLNTTAHVATSESRTVAIAPEGTRRRSNSVGPDQLLPFKKGPFHLSKAVGVDIIPCAIAGSHRLWKPGHVFPLPGTISVKYLERIPKEFIEKSTVEEVQAEVQKRLKAELEFVPDEVIYNSENKPYKVFISVMLFVSIYWTLLIKLFY
jgi:1-acyl-sn-glycerol-3-phosphate acyltransferase